MFGISGTAILIGAIILILMGLVIAYKGFDLLKNFVRTTGAIIMGILFFIIGGVIGILFGPLIAIVAAIIGGILGLIIGAILAPTLLWLLLSAIVFIICFNLGATGAESLGASELIAIVAGIFVGLIGSWFISRLARALLVGATALVGGLLVGAGAYLIILDPYGFTLAIAAGIGTMIFVAATGFMANRDKGHRKKKRKHGRKKD